LEDEDRQYEHEDRATDSLHPWVADNNGGEVDRRARTGSEFFSLGRGKYRDNPQFEVSNE
jgi:hypothetical protein